MDRKLLFILLAFSSQMLSAKNTQIYNNYKSGIFNDTLFLPKTYLGIGFDIDYCMSITRAKYIDILKSQNLQCGGSWCINGNYSCSLNGKTTPDCYQMEHIIDLKNSNEEYGNYDKNILGNVIMAYGRWNMQVGQLDWEDIKNEKREIYGALIFDTASRLVKKCSGYIDQNEIDDSNVIDNNGDGNEEQTIYNGTYIFFGVLFVLIMFSYVVFIFIRMETVDDENKEEGKDIEEGEERVKPDEPAI